MGYKVLKKSTFSNDEFSIATITPEYIQLIRQWRNSQLHILRQNDPVSEEEQVRYFEQNVFPDFDKEQPAQVLFNFFHKEKFIAYGGIVHIAGIDNIGEISFLLDPELNNGNYYSLAFSNFLQLMDRVAFQELGLDKLFTETYDTRKENVTILESCGYSREGILVSHKCINGKRTNVYLHGRLKDQFI